MVWNVWTVPDRGSDRFSCSERKYFEEDDHGHKNEDYDDTFSAQDAIDEIHDIVGDI